MSYIIPLIQASSKKETDNSDIENLFINKINIELSPEKDLLEEKHSL